MGTPTVTFGLLKVREGYSLYFPDDIDRDTSPGQSIYTKSIPLFSPAPCCRIRDVALLKVRIKGIARTCTCTYTTLAQFSPLCFLSPLTASPFINSRRKLFQSHVTNTGLIYDRSLLLFSFSFLFFFPYEKAIARQWKCWTRLFDARSLSSPPLPSIFRNDESISKRSLVLLRPEGGAKFHCLENGRSSLRKTLPTKKGSLFKKGKEGKEQFRWDRGKKGGGERKKESRKESWPGD